MFCENPADVYNLCLQKWHLKILSKILLNVSKYFEIIFSSMNSFVSRKENWNCTRVIPFTSKLLVLRIQVFIFDINSVVGNETVKELDDRLRDHRVTFLKCDVTNDEQFRGKICNKWWTV